MGILNDGRTGNGIAGKANEGRGIAGIPGNEGKLGILNDGRTGNGIAGRANEGRGIGGKAQFVIIIQWTDIWSQQVLYTDRLHLQVSQVFLVTQNQKW